MVIEKKKESKIHNEQYEMLDSSFFNSSLSPLPIVPMSTKVCCKDGDVADVTKRGMVREGAEGQSMKKHIYHENWYNVRWGDGLT